MKPGEYRCKIIEKILEKGGTGTSGGSGGAGVGG